MAADLAFVTDADGGITLVGTVDGLTLAFAYANPSQVAVAKAEQGWTASAADPAPTDPAPADPAPADPAPADPAATDTTTATDG
jgi:hypothetical protein